jgi:hypothetical protein
MVELRVDRCVFEECTLADVRGMQVSDRDLPYLVLRGATVEAICWTTADLTGVHIDMTQALAMSYGALIDSPA